MEPTSLVSPALAGRFFNICATREAALTLYFWDVFSCLHRSGCYIGAVAIAWSPGSTWALGMQRSLSVYSAFLHSAWHLKRAQWILVSFFSAVESTCSIELMWLGRRVGYGGRSQGPWNSPSVGSLEKKEIEWGDGRLDEKKDKDGGKGEKITFKSTKLVPV